MESIALSGYDVVSTDTNSVGMEIKLQTEWHQYLQLPDTEWSLCHVALLIASHLQPELNLLRSVHQLEDMTGELAQRVKPSDDIATRLQLLNHYFYNETGFVGNAVDYYNPDNSMLNKVIDTRMGIPITLAILYMHFAEAINIPVFGISFPGHFLVGVNTAQGPLILDTFNQAEHLEKKKLFELLAKSSMTIENVQDIEKYLVPAPKRFIIIRLLRNLKNIYMEKQQAEKALIVIELILSIVPDAADELRDRGMIYHHLEYTQGAIHDLKRFLELQPHSSERTVIEALLESLSEQTTHLH